MKKTLSIAALIILIVFRVGLHYFYSLPSTGQTKDIKQPTMQESKSTGSPTVSQEENRYINAIKLGGEWFLNNEDNNFIYYEYHPYDDVHPNSSQSLREMGALWSITELAKFLDDDRYTELAEKGFSYFEKTFEFDKENDFYYVNITPDKVKLGYSAFMILSLINMEHPKKEEYLEKFANGIMFHQSKTGELDTFFFSGRDTGKDYYPGEALFAMITLYEYSGNEKHLETVKKAFPFYVDYFRENPNTAFVPWQSRAYAGLYKHTKDPEVADFLFEMNDFMLEENMPQEECDNFAFPRGITTAVFLEGVNKAYEVAVEAGDEKHANCYKNFIEEAVDHTISLQITDITKSNLELFALGGFLGSQTSGTMRVDQNQHAVMSIIDAYNLGILE